MGSRLIDMDLVERLRAALDEEERIAREACDGDSGEWFVGRRWNVYRAEDLNPRGEVEENRLVVEGIVSSQSEHIAFQCPKATLEKNAGAREILGEHGLADVEYQTYGYPICQTCKADLEWPCPTIRVLAKMYRIEVEA